MTVKIIYGDCREVMAAMEAESVNSIVTDPPYGLQFMGREWDRLWRNNTKADQVYIEKTDGELTSRARKLPDYSATKPHQMQTWHYQWAVEALRLLKPGGHMLAFGGTRTYHRMACAIEDAGFEIRDQIQWLYGSGFPKSHDVSKGIDKAASAEREITGVSSNAIAGGTGFHAGVGESYGYSAEFDITTPATESARDWQGWGTALKPACEPIVLARKPLGERTIAANVLEHGTGALNIDGCRVETDENTARQCKAPGYGLLHGTNPRGRPNETHGGAANGRWPANVIHDGSPEVMEAFAVSGESKSQPRTPSPRHHTGRVTTFQRGSETSNFADTGTVARFFYSAKADKSDRLASKHPTVKPVDLMAYLVRLITPPGGIVLDPFAGSGTTAMACIREGFKCIVIEREAEYITDIKARLAHVKGDDTPLFKNLESK